ncbi:hypothetical protein [Micromonospora inyonensis]|uniref:Uncharacterized protein n=1 Tax=Micromonospora inyonensis TaxID=47866 RepID=A0A1C6R7C1_9ACTN|nr:hypothetical protein [Micromonospora inyonensis]SCL12820.1 hypothetical protein GA0074694_0014 [Micromonospora inyonensis]SCL21605.1 hypothetical protein GA0074694_3085 [Micromonospora inyonensis]
MTDTTTTTALDLDAIRRVAGRATDGPWTTTGVHFQPGRRVINVIAPDHDDDGPALIAELPIHPEDDVEDCRADGELIAAARTLVPALIAEVDRLRDSYERAHADRLARALERDRTIDEREHLNAEVGRLRAELGSFKPITVTAGEQLYLHQCPGSLITRWAGSQPPPSYMECCEREGNWQPTYLRAEQPGAHPCNCCYVDGHTRRCGRPATTETDIAPFGILAVAAECRDRINRTGRAEETQPAEPEYLIWSNHHGAWFAPNGAGYRSNVNDAGRYTLADTRQWLGRGCRCCEVPEVPVPAEQVLQAGMVALNKAITAATTAAIQAGNVNRHYAGSEVAR